MKPSFHEIFPPKMDTGSSYIGMKLLCWIPFNASYSLIGLLCILEIWCLKKPLIIIVTIIINVTIFSGINQCRIIRDNCYRTIATTGNNIIHTQ